MSGKRNFEQEYFTFIQNKHCLKDIYGQEHHFEQDFSSGKILLSNEKAFKIATIDNLGKLLMKELYSSDLPNNDDYNSKLCLVNIHDIISEEDFFLVTNRVEIITSYKLDIETLVKFNICELPFVFNTLLCNAETDTKQAFEIWSNAPYDFKYCLGNLLFSDFASKESILDLVRIILMICVRDSSLCVLEFLYSQNFMIKQLKMCVPYYASALGKVNILNWWYNYCKNNDLEMIYDNFCLDRACRRGHVEVLKWWFDKLVNDNMMLLYTHRAMDSATLYCQIHILQSWLNNKEMLENKGYQILYTEEGFNLNNVLNNSPFEQTKENEIYGHYIFNVLGELVDNPVLDTTFDDYTPMDRCADLLVHGIKWWKNSTLPIKYSLKALKDATEGGYIHTLNAFKSFSEFNFKKLFSELTDENRKKYFLDLVTKIENGLLPCYQKYLFDWWISYDIDITYLTLLIANIQVKCKENEYVFPVYLDTSEYEYYSDYYDNDELKNDLEYFWQNNTLN